jgi:hypothetical protein
VASEDVFEPLFLVFPGVSLEIFVSFFGGGLTSWEVSFPPFYCVRVDRFLEFSSVASGSHFCVDRVPPGA